MFLRHALVGCVLVALPLTGCSSDATAPAEQPPGLTLSRSGSGDSAAAVAKLDNGKGMSIATWTTTGTAAGKPSQAVFVDTKAGVRQRIVYSTTGATLGLPILAYNEATREAVRILYSEGRIDFWVFNAAQQYVGGSAATYKNAKLQLSDITSRPVFSGQISGTTNVLSFSVTATPNSGLSGAVDAPANLVTFFRPYLDAPATQFAYNRALFSAAALMLAGDARPPASLVSGQPSRSVSVQNQIIPVYLAYAAAATLYASYVAYQNTEFVTGEAFSIFDAVTADGIAEYTSPLTKVKEWYADVTSKVTLPSVSLPKITRKDVTEKLTDVYRATSEFVNPVATPPNGSSTVSGAGVDQTGASYPLDGSVSGQGQLSVTGRSANGRTVNVNGTVSNSTFTGSYSGSPGSGAISGTVAPLGRCQAQTASGGQGTFARSFDMGATTGSVTFTYNAFSVPDAFEVIANGRTTVNTGSVSGSGSRSFALDGGSVVSVVVSAPRSGTAWNFSLSCPR